MATPPRSYTTTSKFVISSPQTSISVRSSQNIVMSEGGSNEDQQKQEVKDYVRNLCDILLAAIVENQLFALKDLKISEVVETPVKIPGI